MGNTSAFKRVLGLVGLLLVLMPVFGATPGPVFEWAKTWGGSSDDMSQILAVGGDGSILVGGFFGGSFDFDPGPGVDPHSATGGRDAYVTKFDAAGNFVWALTWGGAGDDSANGVGVDGAGNVYVSGRYRYSVDFNPGSGEDWHPSNNPNGGNNAFLSKFDSAGNFLWARTWGGVGAGGTLGDEAYGVALDPSGNIYVSGDFSSPTVDFDPGSGTDPHNNNGFFDAFVTKFDPSGNFLWARTWGGTGYDDATRPTVDRLNVLYVEGIFQSTVDFDPGTGVDPHATNGTVADYGVFVSKFDASGNFKWARTWGGSGWDIGECVASDGVNVYVAGYFESSDDFNPGDGSEIHSSNGSYDGFLSKFDAGGNYKWTKTWGGSGEDKCNFLMLDDAGNLYVSGWFNGTVDFDPGDGSHSHASNGGNDAYFSKLDSGGNLLWAETWGGSGADACPCLALDGDGNIYGAGWFGGTVDFNPGAGVDNHAAAGGSDAFLTRFTPPPAGEAPVIVVNPAATTVCAGQAATLTVTATGTAPMHCQWYRGNAGETTNPVGVDSFDYTTPSLTITRTYWVRITNDFGTADSSAAVVTVNQAPSVAVHPQSQTVPAGHAASLTVAVTGTPPFHYAWYQGASGNTAIPAPGSADAPDYTTPPLNATTLYWVRVSNDCGQADSQAATLSVGYTVLASHAAATDMWWTRLNLANVGEAAVAPTLTARSPAGEVLETKTLAPLAAGSAWSADVRDVFAPATLATDFWVSVQATAPLRGVLEFGTVDAQCYVVMPMASAGMTTLYFPYVVVLGDWYTGVTLVNVATTEAHLQLQAFSEAGALLSTQAVTLASGAKYVRLVNEVFLDVPDPSSIRFVKGVSDQPVTGFELFGNLANPGLAGLPAFPAPSGAAGPYTLVYPEVLSNADFYTGVTFSNLGAVGATATAELYDAEGGLLARQLVGLLPLSQYTREIWAVFGGQVYPEAASMVVSSAYPLMGFELYLSRAAAQPFRFDGVPAAGDGALRLDFPLVKTGAEWTSAVRLVNRHTQAIAFTVRAGSAAGLLLGSFPGYLPIGGRFNMSVAAMFPSVANDVAVLQVESNGPLTGDLFMAANDLSRLGSYPGLP